MLVVGLQKSGTSLLLRLLSQTKAFRNPVRFEGRELWGDDPPFAPEAFPAGVFYQRAGGAGGHELGAAEATEEVRAHLSAALAEAARPGKALVLKNPYNTVRVPWLRAALPGAVIVGVVRRPLPNVFSLFKKHVENPHVHRGPEEGWWGVKPAGWRELIDGDRVLQAARQWARVNGKLWADRADVERIVPYHELCAEPGRFVAAIAELAGSAAVEGEFPQLEALDDEHERGGPLESANRVFKRTGSLDLAGAERDEAWLEPFTDHQRAVVREVCGPLAGELGL
ncbi:MAG: sulfotransferase family protein [Solirubrobacterales bacterium]